MVLLVACAGLDEETTPDDVLDGSDGLADDLGCADDECSPSQRLVAIDTDDQEPTDPDVCSDDCGDGLVYLCATGHAPYSNPHTICIDPEDSEAYTIGSYGYCGVCEPQPPCPNECGEGSNAGQLVCTDAYGDNGGPHTICKQGPMVDGEYCGPCGEEEQQIPR